MYFRGRGLGSMTSVVYRIERFNLYRNIEHSIYHIELSIYHIEYRVSPSTPWHPRVFDAETKRNLRLITYRNLIDYVSGLSVSCRARFSFDAPRRVIATMVLMCTRWLCGTVWGHVEISGMFLPETLEIFRGGAR